MPNPETPLIERIVLQEWRQQAGAWTVEAYDDDGGVEQTICIGPRAKERAEHCVRAEYGDVDSLINSTSDRALVALVMRLTGGSANPTVVFNQIQKARSKIAGGPFSRTKN